MKSLPMSCTVQSRQMAATSSIRQAPMSKYLNALRAVSEVK